MSKKDKINQIASEISIALLTAQKEEIVDKLMLELDAQKKQCLTNYLKTVSETHEGIFEAMQFTNEEITKIIQKLVQKTFADTDVSQDIKENMANEIQVSLHGLSKSISDILLQLVRKTGDSALEP